MTYSPLPGPTLVAFLYLFLRLVQSLGELSVCYNDFRVNSVGIETVHRWVTSIVPQISPERITLPATRSPGESEFNGQIDLTVDNIDFWYRGTDQILFENFSLSLKRGDCLLITGDSGSGKSTLLSLLLGLLHPTKGTIKINGSPIHAVRSSLSAHVGYVGPVPYIVEGTVRDNLLYGHPDAKSVSDDDIKRALLKTELKDHIQSLPLGLDTLVNENASKFSTGQKQRLTFARALIREPVILILDEASANLDVDTESRIIANLKILLPTQITLVVSHRPAFGPLATHRLNLNENLSPGPHHASGLQRSL